MSVTEAATGAKPEPGTAVTKAGRKPPRLVRRGGQRQRQARKRHSVLLNVLMTVMLAYALLPLRWAASWVRIASFSAASLW